MPLQDVTITPFAHLTESFWRGSEGAQFFKHRVNESVRNFVFVRHTNSGKGRRKYGEEEDCGVRQDERVGSEHYPTGN